MADEQLHYRVVLTDGQKAELMNLLKEGWGSKQVDNRRVHERVEYWLREVGLEIVHPGGGVGLFLVYPREVSAGGISVIHGAFVHPHSRCKVQMTTTHGKKQLVTGRVVWCNHLRGSLHGLGIQFDQPIDLKLILERKDWPPSLIAATMNASKNFAGKILYIDDQEVEHELLAFYLRNSAVELYRAFDRDQAIDEIEKRYFDLIICDLNLGSGRGEKVISDIRQAEFRGPIIVLTSESTHSRLEAAQNAGATKIIPKPYEPAVLLGLIEECLKSVGAQGGEDPIYSELGDQPGMAQMIGTYLDRVKRITNQLVLAIEKEDLESVRHCCQTLRATGTGYGFPLLANAANQAIIALDASSSIPESQAELERLEALVRRLKLRSNSSASPIATPTSQPAPPSTTTNPPRGS